MGKVSFSFLSYFIGDLESLTELCNTSTYVEPVWSGEMETLSLFLPGSNI